MTVSVTLTPTQQRLIEANRLRKARLMGKPKLINIARCPEQRKDEPQETPRAFIYQQCGLHQVSYDELRGNGRRPGIIEIRHAVIKATAERFPNIPVRTLARLMGRSTDTINNVLGRPNSKKPTPEQIEERNERAKALYLQGLPLEEISSKVGVCVSTIQNARDKGGWGTRNRPPMRDRGAMGR